MVEYSRTYSPWQVTFHQGEVICTQGDVLGELLILEAGQVHQ